MARIYLSSTFEDLQSYRPVVYQTLRQMHHDVISMEDYVAGDSRPLDKCLADVATCEIYVGIFALRYGFIPPKDNPEGKSITELEYRKASAEGKIRLIFMLDEQGNWPIKYIDAVSGAGDGGRLIRSLRDELSLEHGRAIFKTPDDLARQVSVAINEVQLKWTTERIEQQRKDAADAGAQRVRKAGQRVAGQPILDVGEQFRGRLVEQRELGRLLGDKTTRLVSVIGRAGIGKTALASKVLGELERNRWPPAIEATPVSGIVYLSTRTAGITLDRLFEQCADLLDDDDRQRLLKVWTSRDYSVEDKVERLLQALDQGVYVILLDHLEDLLDADGRVMDEGLRCFLERSLAAPRGTRLLVTSRTPISFDGGTRLFDRQLPLTQGLPAADGVALLRELDPNGLLGLRDLPDDQLTRAVERVHGVPRALEVLAGLKRDKRLRSLDAILDGFYQEHLVDELIHEGYRRLDAGERHIVDALAVLGRPSPVVAVEFMVAPWSPGLNVDALIGRLVDIYMVTWHAATERLSVDAIDQDYALSQLPATGEYSRQSLNARAAEYYSRLQIPKERWRALSDLEPYLREVEHRDAAGDFDGAARTLGRVDANFVALRGNPHALAERYERVLSKIQDPHLRALNLARLGILHVFLGPIEDAIARLIGARDLARQTADRELEWQATGWLGEACRRLGRLDEAVAHLEEAARIAAAESLPSEIFALLLSLTLSYKGQFREAIACSEAVLQEAVTSGNIELQGHVHDGQSLAYLGLGEYDKAYDSAQRAIALYTQVGARDPMAYVYNVQGMACIGLARLDEARTCLDLGRRFGKDDSNPRLEGISLFNLARLCRIANDPAEARTMAEAARDILGSIGAAEASAASALCDAIAALQSGDRARAAAALLACGRASLANADLHVPLDLLAEARTLAAAENLSGVAADAEAGLEVIRDRRRTGQLAR